MFNERNAELEDVNDSRDAEQYLINSNQIRSIDHTMWKNVESFIFNIFYSNNKKPND